MNEPKIPGGYILLSRKIIESQIWDKPPLYLKVWIYLLSRAQHSEYRDLKKGQLITSIPDIMDDCSWHVGYRKIKPTKDQVYQVIEWLRNPSGKISRNCYESNGESNKRATMITTMKATQSMLINVENYSYYQDSKNYESNNESNNENETKGIREQRQPDNINKNDKNDKNNNIILSKDNICNTEELQPIIDKWNSLNLSKAITLKPSTQRYKMLKARIKEYGIDKIIQAIESINNSSFLKGQNNRSWVITFDWLVRPNNFPKVLEGNYLDKNANNQNNEDWRNFSNG